MLGILMTTIFIINEYNAFNKHIENIKAQFKEQYRDRLQEEIDKIINYITEHNKQANSQIEKELRQKVQSAYTIASHIHHVYEKDQNIDQLKQMVLELLRPIRWSEDNGSYFIVDIKTNTFQLYADDPVIENLNISSVFNEKSGMSVVQLLSTIQEKGADFFEYTTHKPGFPQLLLVKSAFIKYFEPFDWIIGAEVYKKGMEEMLQAELLDRIRLMHFGTDGNFFIFRKDGTILTHTDKHLIGRSILDISDETGMDYGKKLFDMGINSINDNYIELMITTNDTKQNRLFLIKPYNNWDWIICANISMNELNRAIQAQTATYRIILTKNIILFLLLLGIAVVILLFASYFYSFKLKNNIDKFTLFFKKAIHEKTKIQESDMIFNEFIQLSQLANAMIDDLIAYEWHKKQDEIRLNTLLELANIKNIFGKDIYKIVLNKILSITNSKAAYLSIADNNLKQLNIIVLEFNNFQEYSTNFTDNTLPNQIIKLQNSIICNNPNYCDHQSHPYSQQLHRHLDVPFIHEGDTVLVAGVCNAEKDYEMYDANQIALILNGLWLQILRMRAEAEMLALERQVIAISEQERSNIGKDLHDNLCSHLSGVELLTKALAHKARDDNQAIAQQLETIRTLIKEAVEKARQLAHGLYPVHIAKDGIEAAIEALTLEIQQLFHINCTCSFYGTIRWSDHNIPTQVYCIVREAVFNAAKHAESEHIHIECRTSDNYLNVTVMDDGKGFDMDDKHNGLGLHTMRYRAKAIGATLKIVSMPSQGTTITLSGEI